MSVESEKRLASIIDSLTKMPNLTYMGNCVDRLNKITKTMVGATSSRDGTEGFVPKPTKSNSGQFLRGDGTWHSVITVEDADSIRVKSEVNKAATITGYLLCDTSSKDIVLNKANKLLDIKAVSETLNVDNTNYVVSSIQIGSKTTYGLLELQHRSQYVSTLVTDNIIHHTTYHLPSTSESDAIIMTTANLKQELRSSTTTYNINGNAATVGNVTDGYYLGTYGEDANGNEVKNTVSWRIRCKFDADKDDRFKFQVIQKDGTVSPDFVVSVDHANNASNADNAAKLGKYADAYHMCTIKSDGTGYMDQNRLSCNHNYDGDGRFKLIINNQKVEYDVSVDYATKSSSSDTATYASKKTGTTRELVANGDSSVNFGSATIANGAIINGKGVIKTDDTQIPLVGLYYRPIYVTDKSTTELEAPNGTIWIQI